MAIKREPTKLVIITNTTVLHELNGIRGPILSPQPIAVKDIFNLINGGINVYEVNPNKPSEKIKLTRDNYDKTNFIMRKKVEVPKVETITKESTDTSIIETESSEYRNKKDKKK